MIALKPPMKSRNTGPGNRRFATCWALERSDGVTLRVTDHNATLNINGFDYRPTGGWQTSARERLANFQDRNAEVTGYLNSEYITEEDLRAGKYQDAKVIELVVDWLVPWAGIYSTAIYYIQQVSFTGEVWQAQVLGLTARIRKPVGDVYCRLCRHDLGNAFGTSNTGCHVDKSTFTATGTVSVVSTQRVSVETSLTSPDYFFNRGILSWTSGANLDTRHEVQSYKHTNGKLVFYLPTPYDIAVGDTFTVEAGCDKRIDGDCKNKFDNIVDHGGFPFIPGTDRMIRTPTPR